MSGDPEHRMSRFLGAVAQGRVHRFDDGNVTMGSVECFAGILPGAGVVNHAEHAKPIAAPHESMGAFAIR